MKTLIFEPDSLVGSSIKEEAQQVAGNLQSHNLPELWQSKTCLDNYNWKRTEHVLLRIKIGYTCWTGIPQEALSTWWASEKASLGQRQQILYGDGGNSN